MLVVISFVLLFAPLFKKFRIFEKENLCANFMSMEYTTVLRAVAILMVMQQHLSGFIFGSRIFTPFGGGGVAIFLIISGYGLTISTKNKGLTGFWKKKFVRVFIPWLFVWMVMTILQRENLVSYSSLSSLFLLNTTNWYLQYLLLCYIVFYVCHKWFYNVRWIIMSGFSILTFILWGNIQAEQSCSFFLGCLIAENGMVYSWIKNHIKKLCYICILLFCISLFVKQIGCIRIMLETNFFVEHSVNIVLKISLALFVMSICFLIYRCINMKYARFIGKISYELYLVHLFVMIGVCRAFSDIPYIQLITFILGTVCISCLLFLLDSKLLIVCSSKKND